MVADAGFHTASGQDRPHRRGLLFVVSAPSGAGKSTLCKSLRREFPDLLYSVSYTTRKARQGEMEGIDYHFVSPETFRQRIKQGRWAEWAEVYGNFYGTSADFIDANLIAGRDILLDVDVQGAGQILNRYPECVTIFIMPPDMETLRQRLELRATEDRTEIDLRLQNAATEMARRNFYRHVIVNDRLEIAQDELKQLVQAYRQKRDRRTIRPGGYEGTPPA